MACSIQPRPVTGAVQHVESGYCSACSGKDKARRAIYQYAQQSFGGLLTGMSHKLMHMIMSYLSIVTSNQKEAVSTCLKTARIQVVTCPNFLTRATNAGADFARPATFCSIRLISICLIVYRMCIRSCAEHTTHVLDGCQVTKFENMFPTWTRTECKCKRSFA